MLYHAYQAHADIAWPSRHLSRMLAPLLMKPPFGGRAPHRHLAAACEVYNLAEVTHRRPDWGIAEVGGVAVLETTVHRTPFATLLRFSRDGPSPGQKLLLVAPMSGHFATLLRDTVRTLVADHDVYVTDWHNARDVPLTRAASGWTSTSSTSSASSRCWAPARTWWRSASPAWPRSPPWR